MGYIFMWLASNAQLTDNQISASVHELQTITDDTDGYSRLSQLQMKT